VVSLGNAHCMWMRSKERGERRDKMEQSKSNQPKHTLSLNHMHKGKNN